MLHHAVLKNPQEANGYGKIHKSEIWQRFQQTAFDVSLKLTAKAPEGKSSSNPLAGGLFLPLLLVSGRVTFTSSVPGCHGWM